MPDRLPVVVLLITAAGYAGFGLWLGLRPADLLDAFGIDRATPAMLTEIRAFYGGIELAIAAAMLILWRRQNLFAALLIGGLPLAGSAIGRSLGMMVDGFSTLHAGFALLEAVGSLFCLFAANSVQETATSRFRNTF